MKDISIKALIVAVVVAIVLDVLGGVASIPLFATEYTEEAIDLLLQQTNVLLYIVAVSTVSSLVGGFICAKLSESAPLKNAAIFAVLGVVTSLMMATFDPIWLDVVGVLLIIPAVFIGAKFGSEKVD